MTIADPWEIIKKILIFKLKKDVKWPSNRWRQLYGTKELFKYTLSNKRAVSADRYPILVSGSRHGLDLDQYPCTRSACPSTPDSLSLALSLSLATTI